MNPVELARAEIRDLAPYASARALAGDDGILLNANENPWAPESSFGQRLNRYPDPQPHELKLALSAHYGVGVEHLLLTRGSDEGIDLLVRAFCQAQIDQVLICPPCFGMYALSAQIQGATVLQVPLISTDDDFILNTAALEQALPCKLYFLCSPNNPTGSRSAAAEVLALAKRVRQHGLVVLDEAYVEFQEQPSLASHVAEQSNLVVLRTLSKAFGLAGCRVGVLIAHAPIIELLRRIIAPYPLPSPSVQAALQALTPRALATQKKHLAVLAAEKARLIQVLKAHAAVLRVWQGHANFVLVNTLDAAGLVRAADTVGIRLRDQSLQAGLQNSVRITIGTPEENNALINFFSGWRP